MVNWATVYWQWRCISINSYWCHQLWDLRRKLVRYNVLTTLASANYIRFTWYETKHQSFRRLLITYRPRRWLPRDYQNAFKFRWVTGRYAPLINFHSKDKPALASLIASFVINTNLESFSVRWCILFSNAEVKRVRPSHASGLSRNPV